MSRTKKNSIHTIKTYLKDFFYLLGDTSLSKYKKLTRRSRRAKEKQALRDGVEVPIFKKSDRYNFW